MSTGMAEEHSTEVPRPGFGSASSEQPTCAQEADVADTRTPSRGTCTQRIVSYNGPPASGDTFRPSLVLKREGVRLLCRSSVVLWPVG